MVPPERLGSVVHLELPAGAALTILPNSVSAIAFGQFASPNWETAQGFIPPIGTRTGVPAVQSTNTLQFNLFLPSGTPPADG